MSIVFSISNKLAKSTKLELSRLTDVNGQKPGVQSITTHSRQIAWQFQSFRNGNSDVVIAIESYSRYVLMLPFYWSPSWDEVKTAFYEQWLAHIVQWMKTGGFIKNSKDQMQLEAKFRAQDESQLHRNLDMSINGHITDTQFWIRDYIDQTGVQSFEPDMAKELGHHINTQIKRTKDIAGKKQKFEPVERFLDDSLYRFAQGLCDQPISGCADGNFPNPHQRTPKLTLV